MTIQQKSKEEILKEHYPDLFLQERGILWGIRVNVLKAMAEFAEQERSIAFREGYRMAVIPNKLHLISKDYPEFQKENKL